MSIQDHLQERRFEVRYVRDETADGSWLTLGWHDTHETADGSWLTLGWHDTHEGAVRMADAWKLRPSTKDAWVVDTQASHPNFMEAGMNVAETFLPEICDCERGHNGLGLMSRECDCPAGKWWKQHLEAGVCPVCSGDCGAANPPVLNCPMHKPGLLNS